MSLDSRAVMRVLIERLNWPVRFVRWQAAIEFASLFSSPEKHVATGVFLDWLETRQFEMEVAAGLTVLMCAKAVDRPAAESVKRSIKAPSILADLLFRFIYEQSLGDWFKGHSGEVPFGYRPDEYFEESKGKVVPLILWKRLEELEEDTGLPFRNQWAFEWRKLMDATGSSYSSYPYHFLNDVKGREGIGGQFSQVQCNVYRSAFLRTLACAVQRWKMPEDFAARLASLCLPLSRGLHTLRPISRPRWLADLPEKCCESNGSFGKFARRLIKEKSGTKGMRPVSLRAPISNAITEFGELSIECFYATDDFMPEQDLTDEGSQLLFWPISDFLSFVGPLPEADPEEYRVIGRTGSCIPVCLDIWPSSFGFWQNDYISLGFAFPAPYSFDRGLSVDIERGGIGFKSNRQRAGYWKTWNDNWHPVHAGGGHTRCGSVTEMTTTAIEATMKKFGMSLTWKATLRLWKRASEYGKPELTVQTIFFKS